MPVTIPPLSVLAEFLGATTRHTRRIEIYEADSITRWDKDTVSRLKDGSVTVDYSRDERRALDLTLSNGDGVLIKTPGEFWYDKIIKVFRGVQVREPVRDPKVLVISDDNTNDTSISFRTMLSQIGYGDVRVAPLAATLLDLVGYDIIVSLSPTTKCPLIQSAYAAGYPVLTIGLGNVATWGAAFFGAGATDISLGSSFTVAPRTITHLTANGWSQFAYDSGAAAQSVVDYDTFTNTAITPVSFGTGNTVNAMVIQSGIKRWFMFNHRAYNGLYGIDQFRNLMISAMAWLNPVVAIDTWEVQIGEFMIDKISEPHFPPEVKVTGRDYTKKCMASKFVQATQFATGQALETIIASIAGAAGITKRILPVTGITVGRAFFYERGVSRWDAMKEIANAYNYEIFFDAKGYLIIRPYTDPALTPPSIIVATGADGVLASFDKSTTDTRIYNYVVVTGESSDPNIPPVWAYAKNINPASPTAIQNIGERTFFYTSSFIQTEAQAQAVADSFLAVHALEEFELSFESLMLPWLEVGDIIGFTDPNPVLTDPTTYLLSTLSMPLTLAPMGGLAKRVALINSASNLKLLATFSGGNTAAGTVSPADTGQVFSQYILTGGTGTVAWKVNNDLVTDAGPNSLSMLVANTDITDGQFSCALAALPGSGQSISLIARCSGLNGTSFLMLDALNGATVYTLYKCVAGTFTSIGTIPRTPRVGDIMRITCAGTSIIAAAGGVSITVTEATGNGNTYMGARMFGNVSGRTGALDNWKAAVV